MSGAFRHGQNGRAPQRVTPIYSPQTKRISIWRAVLGDIVEQIIAAVGNTAIHNPAWTQLHVITTFNGACQRTEDSALFGAVLAGLRPNLRCIPNRRTDQKSSQDIGRHLSILALFGQCHCPGRDRPAFGNITAVLYRIYRKMINHGFINFQRSDSTGRHDNKAKHKNRDGSSQGSNS